MAVTLKKIYSHEIEFLLNEQQEGQLFDFKSKSISPAKISRTASAFANSDGGEIFIGIEDDRTIKPFADQEEANGLLAVFFQMFPLQDYCNMVFLQPENISGVLLKIEILRAPEIKFSTDGKIYVRYGAQNLHLSDRDKIRSLEFAKGIVSFEDQRISYGLGDVENSLAITEFALNIIPHPEPKDWLRKQKLILENQATVASTMLFCDEPQVHLPKSGVKIYRYRNADKAGTRDTLAFDPITIEGNCYNLIKRAVEKTVEVTQDIPKLGEGTLENIKYPREAIHEVITNAIIHRDYSINDECHIIVFDNRIEVKSPGKLPGHVTTKNILEERFARNPKIVRILNKFPEAPNKDIGEGLNTTFEKMRELKLRDPIVEEGDQGVIVTLFHELLASHEEMIQSYLKENAEINNSKAREICREGSENKMKRTFDRMVQSGIIERIPDRKGRAAAYQLKK